MIEIQAYKMDGLGNDFIIIDRRKEKIDISKQQIINISIKYLLGMIELLIIKNILKSISLIYFHQI